MNRGHHKIFLGMAAGVGKTKGDADAGGDRTARRRPGPGELRPRRRLGDRDRSAGLSGDDLVWLLEKAPAEVLILRPGPSDEGRLAATA